MLTAASKQSMLVLWRDGQVAFTERDVGLSMRACTTNSAWSISCDSVHKVLSQFGWRQVVQYSGAPHPVDHSPEGLQAVSGQRPIGAAQGMRGPGKKLPQDIASIFLEYTVFLWCTSAYVISESIGVLVVFPECFNMRVWSFKLQSCWLNCYLCLHPL